MTDYTPGNQFFIDDVRHTIENPGKDVHEDEVRCSFVGKAGKMKVNYFTTVPKKDIELIPYEDIDTSERNNIMLRDHYPEVKWRI